MSAKIDLSGEQMKSTDLTLLQGHLQQLIGEPFLFFRFSYGDELSLHFGQPRRYTSARMKHFVKGSYILSTRASDWILRSSDPAVGVICSCEKGWTVSMGSDIVQPGSTVSVATAQQADSVGFVLSLSLSDGSTFQITPAEVVAGESERYLADWELFTPHERFLRVGPGSKWSYLSSHRKPLPCGD